MEHQEGMAKVLFEHWRTSDRELQTDWDSLEPGSQLRGVFMKQAMALIEAGYCWTPRQEQVSYTG